MILKCQRVIYLQLMPNLVVAVYKKIPLPCRSEQGRGIISAWGRILRIEFFQRGFN